MNTEIETKLQSIVPAAVAKANSIIIDSEEKLLEATDCVKFIKDKFNQAEKERKNLVQPFNDGVKNINSRFKQITEPLAEAEKVIKDKILTFQRELEAKKRAEEEAKRKEVEESARAAAELQKQAGEITEQEQAAFNRQLDFAMTKPVEIEKTRGAVTGAVSSIKKKWKATEILDIQALAQAHPELILPNMVEINKLVNSGVRELVGVRIEQVDELSIR